MDISFEEQQIFLDEMIKPCPNCGQERIRRSYSEVPFDQQMRADEAGENFQYFLECTNCNEYGLISGGFHQSPPPMRLKAMPARNTPCDCGSGKKYKRCCGKS